MKQILVLTRMQLGTALEFINMKQKKDRKKSLSVITILILGCALFGFISGSYSYGMGLAMKQFGELELLPGFFMAATCLIILLTSIYKAKGVLFGFKDYDIVMSLPVKASYIVASRLLLLYTINMVFVIGFLVPCYVVYGILATPSISFYVYGGIALVFVPLIPMIIASFIGVILAYISSKFRYSNAVNTIVMITAFMLLFFGMMTLQNSGNIAQIGSVFSDKMNSMYPLAKWFQDGVVGNDIISLVLFLSVSTLTFFIFSLVLGKCFKSLNSKLSAMHASRKFKMKELKQSSQLKSLINKEAKRYFSCTIYVFNTSFSLILMTIGAIAIQVVPIKQLDEMLKLPEVLTMVKNIVPFALAFMVAMCAISASSISLEGKNFWILKAAPVKADTILLSKILFSISLTMPVCALTSISIMIRLQLNFLECVVTLLLPLAYCYLTAVFGLFVNLKLPLMEWKNETVVVKQSAASIIGSLSGFLTVGIPVVLLFLLKQVDPWLVTIVSLVGVTLVATTLHGYMKRHGERLIADL
jgi:ABC-2 type transport system permease protein